MVRIATDGSLSNHDPRAAQRKRNHGRDEQGQRQAAIAAAEREQRQLTDHDPDHHAEDKPHGVQATLTQRRVQGDERGDRCKERIAVAAELVRDRPGHRRRGRALKQPPQQHRPAAHPGPSVGHHDAFGFARTPHRPGPSGAARTVKAT